MRLTLQAQIDAQAVRVLRRMSRAACDDAGFDEFEAGAIEVALGEVLSNAFLHAYGGTPGPVEVETIVERGFIALTVRDDGRLRAAAPRIPTNLGVGIAAGRGLYLISRLMDETEVIHPARGGSGTVVQMVKRSRRHADEPGSPSLPPARSVR